MILGILYFIILVILLDKALNISELSCMVQFIFPTYGSYWV
jgi:hypothetical protein